MADFSIIISYFGDRDHWDPLVERAVYSVERQTAECDLYVAYGDSLHEARNKGAARSKNPYLIFLDADDELDPLYVESMALSTKDLRQPATLGIVDGREDPFSVVIPSKTTIRDGNWLVIGTALSKEMFDAAGGFWDEKAWEDWSLFIRCFALGATWEPVPNAVYRVHVNTKGRNEAVAGDLRLKERILAENDFWCWERGLVVP